MKDREVLRQLADKVRQISELKIMEERARQWTSLNDLHAEKPMVLVSPEGAWREIDKILPVECEGALAREFELDLRRKIYHYENMCDDTVISSSFVVSDKITDSGFGVEMRNLESGIDGGAYKHIAPIQDLNRDFDALHFRQIKQDLSYTHERMELAEQFFGDILDIRNSPGYPFWTVGLTGIAIKLIGLEALMLNTFDNPEGLKRLMRFLSDEMAHYMDQIEALGILRYNNSPVVIGSGNVGLTSMLPSQDNPRAGNVTFKDCWGFGESQETIGLSPEMFGEFIFPYQKNLLERFGLTYYGCCEPVEDRFKYIKQLDNLRCISVSPWSNLEKCVELYGHDYVLCRKPNPGLLCVDFAKESCRREIRETLELAGNLNLTFIMKDTHTISNEPERFKQWVEIAREEIAAIRD